MSLKLSDKELNSLLDEVASDLSKSFSAVKEKLEKAEDEVAKALPPPEEKEAPGSEESSPVPEASESAVPEETPGEAPAAPAGAAPEVSEAAPQDPAQEMGGQLTPEALQAEYEQLPPDELQMHMQACQAALQKLSGGMGDGMLPPAAPPAPAPDMGAPPPAMKSEKVGNTLSKSEELAKSEVASLKEDVEILAKTLKAMLDTPVRKAITSISELSKDEEEVETPVVKSVSAGEFWVKLREVAKRPNLSKSDKNLITDVYEKRVKPEVAAKHLAKLFSQE